MTKVFEKFWDCKQCGHKHIRGGMVDCPSCGKTRGSDTIFYKDSSNMVYLNDEEGQEIIKHGRDWECSYCHSMNKGTDIICSNCGASKSENNGTYGYIENKSKDNKNNVVISYDLPVTDNNLNYSEKNDTIPPSINIREDQNNSSNNNNLIDFIKNFRYNFIVGGIALAIILFVISLFIPRWYDFNVTNKNWERNIVIQEYVPVKKNGWTVPTGGRVYNKVWEYKTQNKIKVGTKAVEETYQSYEKVGSHTEYYEVDLGNGYGKEVSKTVDDYDYVTHTRTVYEDVYEYEDVYDWKYYYEIDEWVYARTETANGSGDICYWPEYILAENERVNSQKESLCVLGTVDNKSKKYYINDTLYKTLQENKTYKVKVVLGNITEIDTGRDKVLFEFE